jgi:hypothetical protein
MTDEEIEYIRNRTNDDIRQTVLHDCRYCGYSDGIKEGRLCNYIGVTGKIRPCLPGECRQKGVFISRKELKKKKKRPFVVSG